MILEELSNAIGVSGEEDDVRAIILAAIRDCATDIQVDALGNLTAMQMGTVYPDYKVMIRRAYGRDWHDGDRRRWQRG